MDNNLFVWLMLLSIWPSLNLSSFPTWRFYWGKWQNFAYLPRILTWISVICTETPSRDWGMDSSLSPVTHWLTLTTTLVICLPPQLYLWPEAEGKGLYSKDPLSAMSARAYVGRETPFTTGMQVNHVFTLSSFSCMFCCKPYLRL